MPDIRIKPQMDKPKVRVANNAPKDAGSILKQEYMSQQREKQPDQKGPVQYATDRVETTGRRGTVATADGMRRIAGRARNKRKGQSADTKQENHLSETVLQEPSAAPKTGAQPNAERRAQTQYIQERREQLQADKTHSHSAKHFEFDRDAVYYPDNPSSRPYRFNQSPVQPANLTSGQETPAQDVAASPREQGRHKVIADAKATRRKARNLTEKETARHGAVRSAGTKPEGRQFIKRRSAGVKQGSVTPVHGAPAGIKNTAAQRAKQMVQRKAQRKMLAQTTTKAKQTAKAGGHLLAQGIATVGRAAAAAVSSVLAAGGGVALLVALLLVVVIGAIAASPFGILFAEENTTPDTVPVSAAVAQVHYDYNAQLEALQSADTYNDIVIRGAAPDWAEILAVFAVKVAGSDNPDAADVVTIDADRIARLKTVFWDMCTLSHQVETTGHPDSDPNDDADDGWTEKVLTITITAKTAADMVTAYGFTPQQISALDELLQQRDVLLELAGNLSAISASTSELLKNLPEDLPVDREAVIRAACSLVGKVNYFWGGKSHAIGWDSRWGQLYKVTAAGSPTTGTYRPYGMDCSGFVDWVFNNALGYVIGHGGGAMMQHTYCTDISWEEAQTGDLAFYPDDEHIGIVAGWDENGNILIVHCASGYNNVVITGKEGFSAVGRPDIFAQEELDGTA